VTMGDCCGEPRDDEQPGEKPRRLSARAAGPEGEKLTPEEIEVAEEEALEWARRVNRC